jgi:hypothetical protein
MRKSQQHGFYSSCSVNQRERRFFSRARAVVERGDVLISGFYCSHPKLLEREQALAGGLRG